LYRQRLATASSAGMLAIFSSVFLILTGLLFIGFGDRFTRDLAPLFAENGAGVIAGIVCMVLAVFQIIAGILVYTFKYTLGGIIILFTSIISTFVGGGFYINTLWGIGAGLISLICPSLEKKIFESNKE